MLVDALGAQAAPELWPDTSLPPGTEVILSSLTGPFLASIFRDVTLILQLSQENRFPEQACLWSL